MQECPFCKEDIKDISYLESKNFYVIYNIAPVFPGHSLLIPKRHIISIFDLTNEELVELILLGRKAIEILKIALKTDAFNISLQEKEEAGQTIAHLHVHIIPRIKGDLEDPGKWYVKIQNNYEDIIDSCKRPKLNKNEMIEIVNYLKTIIKTNHDR